VRPTSRFGAHDTKGHGHLLLAHWPLRGWPIRRPQPVRATAKMECDWPCYTVRRLPNGNWLLRVTHYGMSAERKRDG
jgi:hypothetical protein